MSIKAAATSGKSNRRGIVISVSLTSFMCLLDSYIVNISLPEIAHHFSVASSSIIHINLAYLLVLTSGLSICGKLADRVGLKHIFLVGYLIFICSLAACALAPSLFWLIVGRSIQGLGTAMLLVSSPAFIARYIPTGQQGKAYGIQATAGSLGLMIGAPLGGIISGSLGWRSIFLVNIPIGIVAALLAYRALPPDCPPTTQRQEKFDVTGSILLVCGLVLLIIGLNSVDTLTAQYHWLLLMSGVLILVGLIIWEKRVNAPLLPLEALSNRFFLLITLAFIAVLMLLSGNNFVMPFYLTSQLHLSQTNSGLLMLCFSVSYGLLSLYMGSRSDRLNPAILCMSGMIVGVFSCIFFMLVLEQKSVVCTALFLISIGIACGCFIAPATKMVMSTAGTKNAASIAALNRTAMYLASLFGISLFGMLLGSSDPLTVIDFKQVYQVAPVLPFAALLFCWQAYKFYNTTHTK